MAVSGGPTAVGPAAHEFEKAVQPASDAGSATAVRQDDRCPFDVPQLAELQRAHTMGQICADDSSNTILRAAHTFSPSGLALIGEIDRSVVADLADVLTRFGTDTSEGTP